MTRVVPIEGLPNWDPNVQVDVLIWRDGQVVLSLSPHFDDSDRSAVVFSWRGAHLATIGYPNDEGLHEHPLYQSGFDRLLWVGEVLEDQTLKAGERRFLVPTKENLVDVIASGFSVHRVSGSTLEAAYAAMSQPLRN